MRSAQSRERAASRLEIGAEAHAFDPATDLLEAVGAELNRRRLHCVLVDEAQFLTEAQVLQLCRLAFTLASLAILLNLLPRQQLISGLYVLTYPLRYVGLSRERLAVRLALTLQYADPLYGLPQVIGGPTSYRCWSQQRLNRTASNCTPPHSPCMMA